jgi:hypothetical protein
VRKRKPRVGRAGYKSNQRSKKAPSSRRRGPSEMLDPTATKRPRIRPEERGRDFR